MSRLRKAARAADAALAKAQEAAARERQQADEAERQLLNQVELLTVSRLHSPSQPWCLAAENHHRLMPTWCTAL